MFTTLLVLKNLFIEQRVKKNIAKQNKITLLADDFSRTYKLKERYYS